jgi:hypothetical protein
MSLNGNGHQAIIIINNFHLLSFGNFKNWPLLNGNNFPIPNLLPLFRNMNIPILIKPIHLFSTINYLKIFHLILSHLLKDGQMCNQGKETLKTILLSRVRNMNLIFGIKQTILK